MIRCVEKREKLGIRDQCRVCNYELFPNDPGYVFIVLGADAWGCDGTIPTCLKCRDDLIQAWEDHNFKVMFLHEESRNLNIPGQKAMNYREDWYFGG